MLRTTRPLFCTFCVLCTLLLTAGGCRAGKIYGDDTFAVKHESLMWVYDPGDQLAFAYGVIPVFTYNDVVVVQLAGDCVVINEYMSHAVGICQPAWGVDAETGQSRDIPEGPRIEELPAEGDVLSRRRECGDYVVCVTEPYDQIFVGRRGTPNGELTEVARFKSLRHFSTAQGYILTDTGLLIIRCRYRCVLCVDTKKLPPAADK